MKRVILRLLLGVILASAFSKPSHAQDERLKKLPPEHLKWLEEEVVYIILDREREIFSSPSRRWRNGIGSSRRLDEARSQSRNAGK